MIGMVVIYSNPPGPGARDEDQVRDQYQPTSEEEKVDDIEEDEEYCRALEYWEVVKVMMMPRLCRVLLRVVSV